MRRLITTLLLTSLTLPAYAGGTYSTTVNSDDLNNVQKNETEQENIGVINQTSVYSVGQASTYRIDSIVCPKPALVLSGATSGGNDYNSTYSVSGSVVLPLGGNVGKLCKDAFEARTIHYQLSNEVAVSKECSQLIAANIDLNSQQFPLLSQYCSGVSAKLPPAPPVQEVQAVQYESPKKKSTCEIRARFTEELTGEETSCPLK